MALHDTVVQKRLSPSFTIPSRVTSESRRDTNISLADATAAILQQGSKVIWSPDKGDFSENFIKSFISDITNNSLNEEIKNFISSIKEDKSTTLLLPPTYLGNGFTTLRYGLDFGNCRYLTFDTPDLTLIDRKNLEFEEKKKRLSQINPLPLKEDVVDGLIFTFTGDNQNISSKGKVSGVALTKTLKGIIQESYSQGIAMSLLLKKYSYETLSSNIPIYECCFRNKHCRDTTYVAPNGSCITFGRTQDAQEVYNINLTSRHGNENIFGVIPTNVKENLKCQGIIIDELGYKRQLKLEEEIAKLSILTPAELILSENPISRNYSLQLANSIIGDNINSISKDFTVDISPFTHGKKLNTQRRIRPTEIPFQIQKLFLSLIENSNQNIYQSIHDVEILAKRNGAKYSLNDYFGNSIYSISEKINCFLQSIPDISTVNPLKHEQSYVESQRSLLGLSQNPNNKFLKKIVI